MKDRDIPCTWCYYQYSQCKPEIEMMVKMINKCSEFQESTHHSAAVKQRLTNKFKPETSNANHS